LAKTVTLVGARDAKVSELFEAARRARQCDYGGRSFGVDRAGVRAVGADRRRYPGDAQLPSALIGFKRRHPGAAVIIIASALEPALMLEAMRAGVTECVAEPLSPDEITRRCSVSRPSSRASPGRQGVRLPGAKGGVGTTTAAVNVATELAKLAPLGRAADRPSPGARRRRGVSRRGAALLVVDALENIHRLDDAFLRSLVIRTPSGVDLLASSDRMLTMPIDAARIRALVDVASHQYRYTVLDGPAVRSLGPGRARGRRPDRRGREPGTRHRAGSRADHDTLQRRYGRDRIAVVGQSIRSPGRDRPDGHRSGPSASPSTTCCQQLPAGSSALNNGQPLVIGNHSDLAGRSGRSPATSPASGARSRREAAACSAASGADPSVNPMHETRHRRPPAHLRVDTKHPQYQEIKSGSIRSC